LKPYYQSGDGMVTIYHGQMWDVLPELMEERPPFGLVLTDLPYDLSTVDGARTNSKKKVGGRLLEGSTYFTTEDTLRAFALMGAAASRWVIATVDYHHMHPLESKLKASEAGGLRFVRHGIWAKLGGMPQKSGDRPAQGWEAIAITHRCGGRMEWNGGGRNAVFTHSAVQGDHPAQKPYSLMNELMQLFSDHGDDVLDPAMGSGTTLRVGIDLGRRVVGIEESERWCEYAARRCSTGRLETKVPHQDLLPLPEQAGRAA
jgi:site-specific DNA-methyltransferase (adenine-specific)